MKIRVLGASSTLEVPVDVLEEVYSEYQHIVVGKYGTFGKSLILDGKVQFTAYDEFIYHEMLAYPPLIARDYFNGSSALILGGGDGLLARRLLDAGLNVTIVEIDRFVLELSRKHFYELGSSSLDEANIVVGDALQYKGKQRDVVFVDLIDYLDAPELYNDTAMKHYSSLVSEEGLLVFHTDYPFLGKIVDSARKFFPHFFSYAAYVPSFFSLWTFAVFSKKELDPSRVSSSNFKGRYFSNKLFWEYPPGSVLDDDSDQEKVEILMD